MNKINSIVWENKLSDLSSSASLAKRITTNTLVIVTFCFLVHLTPPQFGCTTLVKLHVEKALCYIMYCWTDETDFRAMLQSFCYESLYYKDLTNMKNVKKEKKSDVICVRVTSVGQLASRLLLHPLPNNERQCACCFHCSIQRCNVAWLCDYGNQWKPVPTAEQNYVDKWSRCVCVVKKVICI